MVIRHAKPEKADLTRVYQMAFRFLKETRYGELVQGDAGLPALVAWLLEHGTILVAEVDGRLEGMLALAVAQHPISGELCADEIAWWVEPEHRQGRLGYRLLCAAEHWARQKGVHVLKMVAPVDSRVGQFYEHLGYTAVETMYQKVF